MRLADGGRVDRDAPLRFTFDARAYTGLRGDTLASALLANGVRRVGTGPTRGRPRGILTAGATEPAAFVQVEEPFPEPMRAATTLELFDGLVAGGVAGRGRLADRPDPGRSDARNAHCDVLVVGAGPAGLAAAQVAARSGARVILADDGPEPGGDLLAEPLGTDRTGQVAAELAAGAEVRVLARTSVVGLYPDNHVIAVERRTEHLGPAAPAGRSRERLWRIRARHVVLATGAHERQLVFAGNDLPGVMLAGAARTYVHRYGVRPGRRAVVLTCDDSAYGAAATLAGAGVEVLAVADLRPGGAGPAARAAAAGLEVLDGHGVVAVAGADEVAGVSLAPVRGGEITGPARELEVDLVAVCGGWTPALDLWSHAGGTVRFDPAAAAIRAVSCRQAVTVAGAAAGEPGVDACLRSGDLAGRAAATAAGFAHDHRIGASAPGSGPQARRRDDHAPDAGRTDWIVPALDGSLDTHVVDVAREVTVADVLAATGVGLRSPEHVKRFTTAGTGSDQARSSADLVTRVVADALGVGVAELGAPSRRPPAVPVAFTTLAGRDRGMLLDPLRTTPLHDRHVALGAVFEDVGQWRRPRHYPRSGEDMAAAVLRECHATRTDVACMDVSTLGMIDLQGPDAGGFLDRMYTGTMSTLRVGAIRYGVLCGADGMVFDDGTVIRLGERHFLVTTTTGNAAAVLDRFEEWLQTEWPHLRVHCTSVTEHRATIALVGPRSRDVLAALAPDLPLDAAAFPFMTWRDAVVTGLDALVCRISFSGELAYEVTVRTWDAPALWDAIAAHDVTPYGTETMHVLRAEKGYPIVGQDTDGTVTPHDLGLEWLVSKTKRDFVGKRSFTRADTARPDRPQLVALLPGDPDELLVEGAQVVAHDPLPAPPVPALGHVTSSYRSAALGRTFALALVRGGRDRLGQRLHVTTGRRLVPVTVAGPVLYDPEGARRDGEPRHPGRRSPTGTGTSSPATAAAAGPPTPARPWSPLAGHAARLAAAGRASGGALRLAEWPAPAQVDLRLDPAGPAAAAVARALGVALPARPGSTAAADDLTVLWLGPDEWLVLGTPGTEGALTRDLRAALGDTPGAVVDVSAQRAGLLVDGPAARDLLAGGCALDLHPRAFAPGRCARTRLARAQVVLLSRADGGFGVLVASSYAGYLADWLLDAAVEYDTGDREGPAWRTCTSTAPGPRAPGATAPTSSTPTTGA